MLIHEPIFNSATIIIAVPTGIKNIRSARKRPLGRPRHRWKDNI
jgi:hypothetical protein